MYGLWLWSECMDYGYEVNVWIMVMKWMYGLWLWSECIDSSRCMDYDYKVNV